MDEKKARELCLRCVVDLEEAGYEATKVSGGATCTCTNCGRRTFGHRYTLTYTGSKRREGGAGK